MNLLLCSLFPLITLLFNVYSKLHIQYGLFLENSAVMAGMVCFSLNEQYLLTACSLLLHIAHLFDWYCSSVNCWGAIILCPSTVLEEHLWEPVGNVFASQPRRLASRQPRREQLREYENRRNRYLLGQSVKKICYYRIVHLRFMNNSSGQTDEPVFQTILHI